MTTDSYSRLTDLEAAALDEAETLRAELDKVRGQLADTQKRAHADATNLQQILRDKTALANENARLRRGLDDEERQHRDTLKDRDYAQQMCDDLAEAIAELTGVEIGEHSSMNNPWQNALQAATEAAEKAEVAR